MDASSEQLVLDYLCRLGDAAQRMMSLEERLRFMVKARVTIATQIEEMRGPDAAQVRRLLDRFGDPAELAGQERRRLDDARPAHPSPQQDEQPGSGATAPGSDAVPDETDAAPPPQQPEIPPGNPRRSKAPARLPQPFGAPSPHRPMTARWRPGTGIAAPVQRGDRTGASRTAGNGLAGNGLAGNGLAGSGLAGTGLAGNGHAGRGGPPALSLRDGRPGRPAGRGPVGPPHRPGSDSGGGAGSSGTTPAPAAAPGRPATVAGRPATVAGRPATVVRSILGLARRHPLESIAILLLGAGGAIYPFPLWFIGALLVLLSRLWDARDKWMSLAAPLASALVGGVMIAGLGSRPGGLAGYLDAARTDGGNLIRAGAVLGAAYLAWRVRQGRRPPREPPWRRTPHA